MSKFLKGVGAFALGVSLVLGGVLSLLLGLLIALQLPESAAWALGLIVGIDLVFAGVFLVDLARRLDIDSEGEPVRAP